MNCAMYVINYNTLGDKFTRNDFDIPGYLPAGRFLEQKIVSYPHLCDPDYVVDATRDWVGMDQFKPIPLP